MSDCTDFTKNQINKNESSDTPFSTLNTDTAKQVLCCIVTTQDESHRKDREEFVLETIKVLIKQLL